jgi:hypothetical protein
VAARATAKCTPRPRRRSRRANMQLPPIRRPLPQAQSKDRSLCTIAIQTGEAPVPSSWDTAAANCSGTNGFSIRTLAATPCDFQSRALAPVM